MMADDTTEQTKALIDPSKPAHAVVKVHEDGSAKRNDGIRLKAANTNPYYILMTAHGEHKIQHLVEIDQALYKKNRRMWNAWATQELNDEERTKIAEQLALDPKELAPLSDDERKELTEILRERLKNDKAELPNLKDSVNLSQFYFKRPIYAKKFHFPKIVNFINATFSSRTHFEDATFSSRAHFQGATFSEWADFENTVFNGITNFSNTTFSSKTSFDKAKFQKYVPEFYESKLHQNSQFTTDKKFWPSIDEAIASDSKRAYTRLRQIMNELQKPDDEHFFFRQEMRCKARLEGEFYRATSTLFGWLSHYGHSIGRPLAGLGLIILVPPIVYHVLYLWPCYACDAGEFWHDLALSFANTFAIFGFHKTYFDANTIKNLAWWIKTLSGLQTILGFAFLFLLGLGLRNRFRLR